MYGYFWLPLTWQKFYRSPTAMVKGPLSPIVTIVRLLYEKDA